MKMFTENYDFEYLSSFALNIQKFQPTIPTSSMANHGTKNTQTRQFLQNETYLDA